MSDLTKLRLKQLHGRLGDVVYQLTKIQFSASSPVEPWAPAINAYRCPKGFVVCVEIAGVAKEAIQLEIEGRVLRLEGRREYPEPKSKGDEPVQILALEIDAGQFRRELTLPCDVDSNSVRAEYKDGLLWIYLPIQGQA